MARSFTITQDGESRSFTVATGVGPQGPTGATGATGATGPAGPNEVTTSTSTNITGFLKGNGSTVAAGTIVSADVSDATSDGANNRGKVLKTDTNSELEVGILRVGRNAAGLAPRVWFEDGGVAGYAVDLHAPTLAGDTTVALPTESGNLALTAQSDGTIRGTDLDYANTTDIGAALADADEVLVSDGGGNTTRRKSALSRFWTYIAGKLDGNITIAGTKTFSGQVTLSGQAASSGTAAMTRALVYESFLDQQFQNIAVTSGTITTTGTGASTVIQPMGLRLYTGNASGAATSHANFNASAFIPMDAGDEYIGRVRWSSRFRVGFIFREASTDANTVIRFQIGETYNQSTASDLDRKGIGFKIENDTMKAVTHDGSTLTTSASIASLTEGNLYRIIIDSDGAGNVRYYLNGSLVHTATSGPSVLGGSNDCAITLSVADTTGSASFPYVDVVTPIRIIVGDH